MTTKRSLCILRLLRLALLASCGLGLEAAAFADQDPAAAARFPDVKMSIASESFEKEIPFDSQFTITATVPGTTRFGSVYYRLADEWAEEPPCPVGWESEARPSSPDAYGKDRWFGPFRWTNTAAGGASNPADATMKVFVTASPDAKRSYTFWTCLVSEPSAEVRDKFRDQAREKIDATLAGISVSAVSDQQAIDLLHDLCTTLKGLISTGQVFAGDSLFKCPAQKPTSLDSATREFQVLLSAVVGRQKDAAVALSAYNAWRIPLRLSLDTIRLDKAPLQDFLAALKTTTSPLNREILERYSTSFGLIGLDDAAAGAVVDGRGPVKTVDNPELAKTTQSVAADVAANYQRTETDLVNLRKAVGLLIGNKDLLEAFQKTLPKALPDETITRVLSLVNRSGSNDPCNVNPLPAVQCGIANVGVLRGNFNRAAEDLQKRVDALTAARLKVDLSVVQVSIASATTLQDAATARNAYVSSDAGVLGMPLIGEAATYLGVNIYLRPINPKASLAEFHGARRRFALTFGIVMNSLTDSEHTRFDLFSGKNILGGAGYRVTEALRVSGGLVLFRKADPNPFSTKQPVTWSPFLSFSLDVGLALGTRGIKELFP